MYNSLSFDENALISVYSNSEDGLRAKENMNCDVLLIMLALCALGLIGLLDTTHFDRIVV